MKIARLKHMLFLMYLAVAGYLFINVGGNGSLTSYAIWSRPEFWPRTVLVGLSLTVFMKLYWPQKNYTTTSSVKGFINLLFSSRIILGILIVSVYCFSTEYLGFAFATILFLFIFMQFLGQTNIKYLIIGSSVSVLLILFIFWRLLYVSLPKGFGIFLDFSNLMLTIVRLGATG